MTQFLDRETIEQRVVLHDTWEQFKLIQKAVEDSPRVELFFFAGAIEIFIPGL